VKKTMVAAAAAFMVMASPAMAEQVTDKLSIDGEFIFNGAYKNTDVAGITTKNLDSNVDRATLGFEYQASDAFKGVLALEFRTQAGANNNHTRVKYAYLEGVFAPEFGIRLGSAGLPLVDSEDAAWGFRYVQAGLAERFNLGDTADYGVHAFGAYDLGESGVLSYDMAAIRGAGYQNYSSATTSGVDYVMNVAYAMNNVELSAGYRKGNNGAAPTVVDNKRWNVLGSVSTDYGTIGAEYIWSDNGTTNIKSKAYSVFASAPISIIEDTKVLARYDYFDPNDVTSADYTTTYLLGLEKSYNENVSLAASWTYNKDRKTTTKVWTAGLQGVVKF